MCFIIADPDVTRVKGKLEKNLNNIGMGVDPYIKQCDTTRRLVSC